MKRTEAMPKPNSSSAVARGGDDVGVVGEAEIVIGAEVEQLAFAALRARILDADVRRLRRRDHPLALHEALGLDLG